MFCQIISHFEICFNVLSGFSSFLCKCIIKTYVLFVDFVYQNIQSVFYVKKAGNFRLLKNFQLYVFRELFLYLFCYLNHNSTFHTFAEELTAVFIYTCNIPCCMVSVGSAAAGTVQFCPAVFAVRTCISIAFAEFVLHFRMGNAFPDITQTVSRIAYELMTREQPYILYRCRSQLHVYIRKGRLSSRSCNDRK